LAAPPDVRVAEATFAEASGTTAPGTTEPGAAESDPPATSSPTDTLASLLAGANGPVALGLAALLAAGLGAAHALSPGHGKALIAAYLVGSRGTLRRAAGLGLTVAASHTIGVFVLGAIVLVASETILPERVVAWLSLASGIMVVGIGASVAVRAVRGRHRSRVHGHQHPHSHSHNHPRDHDHPRLPGHHRAADSRAALREVLTLGLVGGMVPSASALIVLLVAVTTGRVLEGMVLIGSFGVGMALVLAGLATATTIVRNGVADASRLAASPRLRQAGAALPLLSAVAIVAAGAAATIGAIGGL
jgi:ABC-type nickel/cobalt efflux system permease component RcnA